MKELVREGDTFGNSEGKAFLVLNYLLKGTEKKFIAAGKLNKADDGGRVTCWPESIQYLIRTYATSGPIMEEIISLRDRDQREGKRNSPKELEY